MDEYILNQDSSIQPVLCQVRDVIRKALPDARARISWKMPTFWRERNLIHFAAQKKHLGLYPGPEAVEHFAPVLKELGFKYSKGAIQFPYDNVPMELISEIAQFCGNRP